MKQNYWLAIRLDRKNFSVFSIQTIQTAGRKYLKVILQKKLLNVVFGLCLNMLSTKHFLKTIIIKFTILAKEFMGQSYPIDA